MKFASLGSGSRGNATLIEHDGTSLLVDCGFSVKELSLRLKKLEVSPEAICAILVTHEHSDHMSGVGPLSRRLGVPVYMTAGTHDQSIPRLGNIDTVCFINGHQEFSVGEIIVQPVTVPHDAREPVQFIFKPAFGSSERNVGLLTDTGSITPHIIEQYAQCRGLLLESNHDLNMLGNGPYPEKLKKRVAGRYGHLNNVQAAEFLQSLNLNNIQHLLIGHISEQNNHPNVVESIMRKVLSNHFDRLTFASQSEVSGWLKIS